MRPKPSTILETSVAAIFPTAAMFSLFLLFAGHNAPGGGFSGGLVAGAAFVLLYLTGGSDAVRDHIPIQPTVVLGLGLLLATVTGLVPMILGAAFLESGAATLVVPVFGKVKATSALAFDAGVYLVVCGLVLTILRTVGSEVER